MINFSPTFSADC